MAQTASCGTLTITNPVQMQGNGLLTFVALGLLVTFLYVKYVQE